MSIDERRTEVRTNGAAKAASATEEVPERHALAVVVAGMHRSGTSAFARILGLLGLDLPRDLYAAREDNPLGYWEPRVVVEAHEEFLAAIGSSTHDVLPLPDRALETEAARQLKQRLVAALKSDYGDSRHFVLKDPRICRLVPLWLSVLESHGAAPSFVLPIRNPLEVAGSLKERNHFSGTKTLLLWLRHVLESERDTRAHPRSVIAYEDLLRDWQTTMRKIAGDLSLVWPRASHTARAEIEDYLSPRRRHHHFSPEEVHARPDVVEWVKEAYEVLRVASAGGRLAIDVLDGVRAELARADAAFGPLIGEYQVQVTRAEGARAKHEEESRARAAALEREAAALREREASLHGEAAALRARLEELEETRLRRDRELDARKREIASLAAQLEGVRADAARLDRDRPAQEDAQEALRGREAALEAEAQELQERLGEALAAAAAGEVRIASSVAEGEVARRDVDVAALRLELEQLQGDVRVRERALERQQRDLERLGEEVRAGRAKLTRAERELARERSGAKRRAAELDEARRAASRAVERTDAAEAEVDRLGSKLATAEEQLSRGASERDALIAASETTARELNQEITSLRSEVERLFSDVATRETAVIASDARATTLEAEKQELEAKLGRERELLEARTRELEAARAEARANETELAALRNQLTSLAQERTALDDELRERRSALDALTRGADELTTRLAEYEHRLEELQRGRWARLRRGGRRTASTEAEAVGGEVMILTRRWRRAPRGWWRSTSHLASWLTRPRQGGWSYVRTYVALRRSGMFDAEYYLARYPDVAESGLNALMHYVEHGVVEGRHPSPDFSAAAYVAAGWAASEARVHTPSDDVQRRPRAELAPCERAPIAGYSDFIFVVGRRGPEMAALRSVLQAHDSLVCLSDAFDRPRDGTGPSRFGDLSFSRFVERCALDDATGFAGGSRERLFLDYLDYLRCLSTRERFVVELPYDAPAILAWHGERPAWAAVLDLLVTHDANVVHLRQTNRLRALVASVQPVAASSLSAAAVRLDAHSVLAELRRLEAEDAAVAEGLTSYERYLDCDFGVVFSADGDRAEATFLESLAAHVGIENAFHAREPVANAPALRDLIVNFDEVVDALSGTEYEQCLELGTRSERTAKERAPHPEPEEATPAIRADTEIDWRAVIGSDPDSFSDGVLRKKPSWVVGSLSHEDARFLFRATLESRAGVAVEIGTGSGLSTALLSHALDFASRAGLIDAQWRVVTYDVARDRLFDRRRDVGDAAREVLPAELLERVEIRAPGTAMTVREDFGLNEIELLFVDANHRHPWPTLDVLAALDSLTPGALVLLHDINLPLRHAEFPDWGAKYLFDDLQVEKTMPSSELPNVGSIVVPREKDQLRRQLKEILFAHEWQADVSPDLARSILEPSPLAADYGGHAHTSVTASAPKATASPPAVAARPRGDEAARALVSDAHRSGAGIARGTPRRRIRVCLVETVLQTGGAEWFAAQLAMMANAAVFDFVVVTYNSADSQLAQRLSAEGIRVVSAASAEAPAPSYEEWRAEGLFGLLERLNPDIVFFPSQYLFGQLPQRRLRDFKVVVRISNFHADQLQKTDFSLAAGVICCSEEQFRVVRAAAPDKATLITTGVDTSSFRLPSPEERAELKRAYGLEGKTVVLFVARLGSPLKRTPVFQEVVRRVNAARDDVAFVVVGYFEKHSNRDAGEPAFRQFVKEEGVVWEQDVAPWETPPFFRMADVLVSTSDEYEGLSNTVLQALASGTIPVVTPSGGMSELVGDSESGLVARDGGAAAIADEVLRAADFDEPTRQRLVDRGRRKVQACFNLECAATEYQRLFLEVYRQRKTRICVTDGSFGIGGAEWLIASLIAQSDPDEIDFHVVARREGSPLLEYMQERGALLHVAPSGTHYDAWLEDEIPRTFQRLRPDVVMPCTSTTWPTHEPFYRLLAISQNTSDAAVLSRHHYDQADYFLCVSEEVRDCLSAEHRWKMMVLHNSIDVEMFAPDAEARLRIRRELNIAPEARVVLWCGRMHEPRKRLDVLREVVDALRDETALHFLVLGYFRGAAPEEGSWRDFLGRHPNVTWVAGASPWQAPPYYSASDVYLSTSGFARSDFEGLSLATVQALAAELPVVTTASGGQREVVEDRVNGRLVDIGDVAGLADAVREVVAYDSQTLAEMRRRNREKAVHHFDIRRHADVYVRLSRLLKNTVGAALTADPALPSRDHDFHDAEHVSAEERRTASSFLSHTWPLVPDRAATASAIERDQAGSGDLVACVADATSSDASGRVLLVGAQDETVVTRLSRERAVVTWRLDDGTSDGEAIRARAPYAAVLVDPSCGGRIADRLAEAERMMGAGGVLVVPGLGPSYPSRGDAGPHRAAAICGVLAYLDKSFPAWATCERHGPHLCLVKR